MTAELWALALHDGSQTDYYAVKMKVVNFGSEFELIKNVAHLRFEPTFLVSKPCKVL